MPRPTRRPAAAAEAAVLSWTQAAPGDIAELELRARHRTFAPPSGVSVPAGDHALLQLRTNNATLTLRYATEQLVEAGTYTGLYLHYGYFGGGAALSQKRTENLPSGWYDLRIRWTRAGLVQLFANEDLLVSLPTSYTYATQTASLRLGGATSYDGARLPGRQLFDNVVLVAPSVP